MEVNKYQNGKIYTIRHPETDKFYIGSTCKTLKARFNNHKNNYKNETLEEASKVLFNLGCDDCYIELLENYSCNTKKELHKREGDLMRLYKDNIVNINIAGRTQKEYVEDNKEWYKDYYKQYRTDNIKKISNYMKEYHKDNKEVILKRVKEYSELNKEKIEARTSVNYNCECGSIVSYKHKSRHIKGSKKHLEFIEN